MLCLQECPARHRLDSHQASVLGASTAVPRCLTTVCLSKRRVHAGSVSVPVAAEPIEIELMSTVATSAEMYRFCTVFASCSMHSQSRYSAVRNAITLTRRCQGKQPGSRTLHRQLDPTFRGSSWDSWPPESLELQAVIHEPHVQRYPSWLCSAGVCAAGRLQRCTVGTSLYRMETVVSGHEYDGMPPPADSFIDRLTCHLQQSDAQAAACRPHGRCGRR